jgi:hypothetical protein
MSPVEFSPQSASATNVGQSEAASAGGTDIAPVAPTISAKAANLDNRIVDVLVFMQTHTYQSFLGRSRLELRLSEIFLSLGVGLLVVESPQLMQINFQVLQIN